MKNKMLQQVLVYIILLSILLMSGCGKDVPSNTESQVTAESESESVAETDTEIDTEKETEADTENEEGSEQESDMTDTEGGGTESVGGSEAGADETEAGTGADEGAEESESEIEDAGETEGDNDSAAEEPPTTDPYVGMTKEEFYSDYKPATSLADALYRSQHGFLSGSLEVPGQYAQEAEFRPMEDGLYVRNTDSFYEDDGNTYVVVDAYGNEVMKIYKGGAYITLEEVAAYMYAFGGSKENIPANYTSSKKTKPTNSMWGEYLRVNHSYFTGNTNKYPYEPELPNISGCGGDIQYWELDIGTTGTETPGYQAKLYNNGTTINRGAARVVYGRQDLNGNGIYEQDEVYVFYTHNHYNDFREYLNYYGGWGEMFGNVTGGGEYSSKTNCNPTPYVPTGYRSFSSSQVSMLTEFVLCKQEAIKNCLLLIIFYPTQICKKDFLL